MNLLSEPCGSKRVQRVGRAVTNCICDDVAISRREGELDRESLWDRLQVVELH
jgi:hypothetical protein